MTFLDRALPLLERGFSLIPITPAGKTPIGGFGATRRSRDRAVIEDWAAQFPTANVGIVADEEIAILESDDATRLFEVLNNGTDRTLSLAATLSAYGSSDNRPHFFFRHTEKSRNVGNIAVPGLFEARFHNQYVVGAGSIHPTGATYRWENNEPIRTIPDWLVDELVRLAMTGKKMTDRIVETRGDKVPEGSRHYFLMREAGKLWDGERTASEMYEMLDEINERHCDPPRSADHIWQCVRDIMARDAYDPGPKVVIGGAFPNPAIFDGLTRDRPIQPEEAEAEIWTPLSADELIKKHIPPRDPVVTEGEGKQVLLYEQSINQILAWRGVGKTNFALGLAGALAAGARLLDFSATGPKRVLYLDGELPEAQLQERVNAFVNREHRENLKFFSPEMRSTPQALNLLAPKDRAALDRLLDSLQPQVIFLDSQSTLMVGDSNKDDFQEKRMQLLRDLRWRGLCVIEMHHVGKTGMQRGLSKNDDVLDLQMFLKKSKDWEPEDGLEFEVVYEKVRHAAKLDSGYKVRLVDGVWKKEASDELELVAACIEKKMSYREIEKKHKISHSRVGRLVKKAHKSGRLDPAIALKSEE